MRGTVPTRWKSGAFSFSVDDPGALAFGADGALYFLARWRGVLLRIQPPR